MFKSGTDRIGVFDTGPDGWLTRVRNRPVPAFSTGTGTGTGPPELSGTGTGTGTSDLGRNRYRLPKRTLYKENRRRSGTSGKLEMVMNSGGLSTFAHGNDIKI